MPRILHWFVARFAGMLVSAGQPTPDGAVDLMDVARSVHLTEHRNWVRKQLLPCGSLGCPEGVERGQDMEIDYRAEFEIPHGICYLNAAYMTPQPRRVLDAARRGAERRSQPWRIAPEDFFTDVETLRALFARMVDCPADNIAIVPSAGYGVAVAARNLPLQSGDVVIVMNDQFPANYYSWRRHARAAGATIHSVNRESGQTWTEALIDSIERHADNIAVVALEGHHWATAEAADLEAISAASRGVDAHVVLDLTQTVGACPVNIGKLEPDFMVAAGYKWQFCPYGVAFLYVHDRHLDGVPIEEAWLGRDGAEDFSRLAEFTDRYQPGARRFDVSEKASFSNIAGAVAALKLLDAWGVATIADVLSRKNVRIEAILSNHGFETVPAERRAPHFQSARLPDVSSHELAVRLVENGVYASVRGTHLRVAPHVYSNDKDLDRFDDVLSVCVQAGDQSR